MTINKKNNLVLPCNKHIFTQHIKTRETCVCVYESTCALGCAVKEVKFYFVISITCVVEIRAVLDLNLIGLIKIAKYLFSFTFKYIDAILNCTLIFRTYCATFF